MSIEKSEAVILKTFNWSESSRTVVFFSLEFGRLALNDKGGRSIKSKRGRLIPFTRMEITFYHSKKETSGYISEVELIEPFSFEKTGALGRLAYASAACELLLLLLPEEEPQRQLYQYFINFLKHIEAAGKKFLSAIFIAFYFRLLSQMGYHPSLAYCASCSKDLKSLAHQDRRWQFSVKQGGIVCKTCQNPIDDYIDFSDDSYKLILALQSASLNDAATLPISLKESSRVLNALTRFVSHQTGFKSDLKSLEFIEKLKNDQVSG